MSLLTITIDQREPAPVHMAVQALSIPNGVPVAVSHLDTGNLWAVTDDGALIVVWRVAAADLPMLIRHNELLPRAAQLRQLTQWAYVVISGSLVGTSNQKTQIDGNPTGWAWDAIQGALLSLQEIGVMVTSITGDAAYGSLIERLGQTDRHTAKKLHPARDALFYSHGEEALMSLPGIGEDKLDGLLKHCRTPAWALVALCDDEQDSPAIPGIGKETKARARHALGLEDNQTLVILQKEAAREERIDSARPLAAAA